MPGLIIRSLLLAYLLSLVPVVGLAHGGEKDGAGCHLDQKTGIRHCHEGNRILPWPPVKKSRSDICHDRESPWYDRTIHFEPFNSMKECLESGGRMPKTQERETQASAA
jgi:hypothetical protein